MPLIARFTINEGSHKNTSLRKFSDSIWKKLNDNSKGKGLGYRRRRGLRFAYVAYRVKPEEAGVTAGGTNVGK